MGDLDEICYLKISIDCLILAVKSDERTRMHGVGSTERRLHARLMQCCTFLLPPIFDFTPNL